MSNAEESVGPAELASARSVGRRLRAIRHQQGFSLHDVEVRSHGEFKGSIVGAYERGDRIISVERLLRLAELYNVATGQFLPTADYDIPEQRSASPEGCTIDMKRLDAFDDPDADLITRYAATLQLQRQDFGDVLTIRHHDLVILATVIGCSADDLTRRLHKLEPTKP